MYIADQYNNRVRKVTVSTGIITTVAGSSTSGSYSGDNGPATSATLKYPYGVALDSAGNVYIADTSNHRIRKVTVSTGIIITVAGNGGTGSYSGDSGPATSATLNFPPGVTVDSAGNETYLYFCMHLLLRLSLGNVYIADGGNQRIRKVAISAGIITTFAGTGTNTYSGDGGAATAATLNYPRGVIIDTSGRNH